MMSSSNQPDKSMNFKSILLFRSLITHTHRTHRCDIKPVAMSNKNALKATYFHTSSRQQQSTWIGSWNFSVILYGRSLWPHAIDFIKWANHTTYYQNEEKKKPIHSFIPIVFPSFWMPFSAWTCSFLFKMLSLTLSHFQFVEFHAKKKQRIFNFVLHHYSNMNSHFLKIIYIENWIWNSEHDDVPRWWITIKYFYLLQLEIPSDLKFAHFSCSGCCFIFFSFLFLFFFHVFFCIFSHFLQSNSHADEHSDREEDDMMREECESSDEGVNLNAHTNETETALDFANSSPKRSPSNNTNIRWVCVPIYSIQLQPFFFSWYFVHRFYFHQIRNWSERRRRKSETKNSKIIYKCWILMSNAFIWVKQRENKQTNKW